MSVVRLTLLESVSDGYDSKGLLMIEVTLWLQILYFLGLMSPVIFMIGWSKGYKEGHKEGRWNGRHNLEKSLR